MRVLKLRLPSFKNLRDFEATFDGDNSVSVVVGRNGVGKSNLIEAIAIIFRDLDLGAVPTFSYDIEYECRGQVVNLTCDVDAKVKVSVTVNGERSSLRSIRGLSGVRLLPDFVFGYYSGPSNRLKSHFEKHEQIFSKALRDGKERPLRRLFYAQPIHSQFVLLAFFLDGTQSDFLNEYLGITDLESALFVLRQPHWSNKSKSATGNPRFWNARGAVADLLDRLHGLALAPMSLTFDAAEGGHRERLEHQFLFIPVPATIRELADSAYDSRPQELFKAFESILAADLLSEVRVRVRARGLNESLVFRELSEGEQQLLMVLGLLRFTQENESLFLLDEPDTHLNPAWSLNYVRLLSENSGAADSSSQLLMATHDPLVIASLLKEQVVLLTKEEGGRIRAHHPESDPRGMGVSGLLTSDIYGLVSELDPFTLEKVERRRWLASSDELSEAQRTELGMLTAELEGLDFNFADRDPLYVEFERAMTSETRIGRTAASQEELDSSRRMAREVLDSLDSSKGVE